MFYRPQEGHGLPHDPFSALVAPRPIGWISTRARRGGEALDNLAPYSFFNAVAYRPPQVAFASTSAKPDRAGTKDSVAQIRDSAVFCVNLVAPSMIAAMNATSAALPAGQSEAAAAGIALAQCTTIDCARVAAAPAALECRLRQIVPLGGEANFLCIGEVTGVHIRPDCLAAGRFVPPEGWLARLGYQDYTVVREIFSLARP